MPPKTVALIAAVSVTIGWLLAATLTPPVARLQSLPEQAQPATTVEPPAPLTQQLNLRLRTPPEPPITRRNPFAFGERERRPVPPAEVEPAADVQAATAAVAGPRYVLAGIGVSGDMRTAVLSDGQSVHVVTLQDVIGTYTVADITDDSVTLVTDSGERHTLRFR